MKSFIFVIFMAFGAHAQSSLNTFDFHIDQIKEATPGLERNQKIDKAILAAISQKFDLPPNGLETLARMRARNCSANSAACMDLKAVAYWLCVSPINTQALSFLTESFFEGAKSAADAEKIYLQLKTCSKAPKLNKFVFQLKGISILEQKWPNLASREINRLVVDWMLLPEGEVTSYVAALNQTFTSFSKMKPMPLADAVTLAKWSAAATGLNLGAVAAKSPVADFRDWYVHLIDIFRTQGLYAEFEHPADLAPLLKIAGGDNFWNIRVVSFLCEGWRMSHAAQKCDAKWSELEKATGARLSREDALWIQLDKAWTRFDLGETELAATGLSSLPTGFSGKKYGEILLGVVRQSQGKLPEALALLEKGTVEKDIWFQRFSRVHKTSVLIDMQNYSQANIEIEKLRVELKSSFRGPTEFSAMNEFNALTVAVLEGKPKAQLDQMLGQLKSIIPQIPRQKALVDLATALVESKSGGDFKAALNQAANILHSNHPQVVRVARLVGSASESGKSQ